MSISTKASFVCWTPGGGRVSFLGQLDSRHVVARKCYQKLVFLFFYFSCILKAFALLLAVSDWTKPQLLQPWMVNTESTCPADIPEEEEELAKQSLNKKKTKRREHAADGELGKYSKAVQHVMGRGNHLRLKYDDGFWGSITQTLLFCPAVGAF